MKEAIIQQGPVVQSWIRVTPGLNLTRCFDFCISARPLISKLQKRKLLLIQTGFLKEYVQVYKQAVGKFA